MDAIYKMGLMDINDDGSGLSGAKRNSRTEMPPPLMGGNSSLLQSSFLFRNQHLRQRATNSDDERDDEHEMIQNYRRRASLDVSLLNDAVLQKRLRMHAAWAAKEQQNDLTEDHDDDHKDGTAPVDLTGNGSTSRRGSRVGGDDDDSRFSSASSPQDAMNGSPLARKLAAQANSSCSGCVQLGQVFLDFLIDLRESQEVSHRQQSTKLAGLIRNMEAVCAAISNTNLPNAKQN